MQPSARILFVIFLVTGFAGSIRSEDSASASRAARSARSTSLSFEQVAAKIDGFVESHWSAKQVPPAKLTDDATFLRRITLDLAGRIPTTRELDQFRGDDSKDKRGKVIHRLIGGPEFPLHFGSVLDEMIQGRHAGNSDFVDYMRRNIRDNRSWDLVFRELMLGPWDTAERKPANRFLDKRAKTLDVLAVDATRVFFGVDISCAKCHDHPLVADWSQGHFYGMASFFNRTTGGKGIVGEKTEGDVKFLGSDGKEKTAQVMFLTGRVVGERPVDGSTADEKPPASKPVSRREQLVEIALEERKFFSRSIVNRLWRYFFGRGLVHPVDQMHSANDSAIPGLLEWLAEDFAASGYDLRRLVTAMVSSRVYQLSSEWPHDSDVPQASLFAVAGLRPLSRRQLSFSMLMATGNAELTEPDEIESRVERYVSVPGVQRIRQYLTIEKTAAGLAPSLDERTDDFQSSAVEALFMSNNPATQALITADDGNTSSLVTRLVRLGETRLLVKEAVRTVLSREPRDDELSQLADWFERQSSPRATTTGQLLWVLVTSAEFRFNH
jgi:hypothetical protein